MDWQTAENQSTEGKRKGEDVCKITLEPRHRHTSKLVTVGQILTFILSV